MTTKDTSKTSSLRVNRKDPATGLVYTFASFRPDPGPMYDTTPAHQIKEFVVRFLWLILNPEYAPESHSHLPRQAVVILPLVDEIITAIWLKLSPADEHTSKGERYNYSFSLSATASPRKDVDTPPSEDLLNAIAQEVIESEAVFLAVRFYIDHFKIQLENIADQSINPEFEKKIIHQADAEGLLGRDNTGKLFPNSKCINRSTQFGIPKVFADGFNRIIKGANKVQAIGQYTKNNKDRGQLAKKDHSYKVNKSGKETELIIDSDKVAIKTAEQFAERLMEVRDARVLQTFCALWKWANTNETATFRDVSLSDIMRLILKESGECKFNKADRQKYSKALEFLASLAINVETIAERVTRNGKPGKAQLVVKTGVRLFDIEAIYSVMKEFQGLPKEELDKDLHFDRSVINRFSGELLPGNAHLFKERASIYFGSILRLNGNQDRKAVLLGFNLQTRFNQLQDKEKDVEIDRGFLVDLCDYNKTDQANPTEATKQIKKVLDKLIEAGIISNYSKFGKSNVDKIKISPPKSLLPDATA